MHWVFRSVCVFIPAVFASCNIFFGDVGEEGGDCSDIGTCNGELVCNFGECTQRLQLGDKCEESQQERMMCRYGDNLCICEDGLWCIDSVCIEAGDNGQPCRFSYSDEDWGACNRGLGCIDGICVPAGDEGEPCIYYTSNHEDDRGHCEKKLECIKGVCTQVGGEDQPCADYDEDFNYGDCDDGLECIHGICLPD